MIIFTVEVNVCWRTNDAHLARNNVDAAQPVFVHIPVEIRVKTCVEMLMLKFLPGLLMSNQVQVVNSKAQKRNVG